MGNNSGKKGWKGVAKVVFGKHGKHALEGFPEKDNILTKDKTCCGGFHRRERESQDRKNKQPETESVWEPTDLDLIHRPLSPPPPSNDHAQAAAPSIDLQPDFESKAVVNLPLGPAAVTSSNQRPTQPPAAPLQAPDTCKQEPAATPLGQGNSQRIDEVVATFPQIQVLNPVDGSPAYVNRAWRPSDVKLMAEWLPDPCSAGGTALAEGLAEMVQQHRPSVTEVRQVCVSRLGLGWGRVQGDFPTRGQADVTFDWDQGSAYRVLVEGLCGRAREAFPLVRDWPRVRRVQQNAGETVDDLVKRLETVFQAHGGIPVPADRQEQTLYEDSLTLVLLDALDERLSKSVKGSCIGWRTARLAMIVSHASHAESLRDERKRNREREARTRRRRSQQEALERLLASRPGGNVSGERKVLRGGARGRGHPQSRGLKKHQACFRCGAMDHWAGDCSQRKERANLKSDWPNPPTWDVTLNNPGGRGGPGPCTQGRGLGLQRNTRWPPWTWSTEDHEGRGGFWGWGGMHLVYREPR
ncbi:unnamed protein product [Boreogadus saida]